MSNKNFFNVSSIIGNNTYNPNISKTPVKTPVKNLEKNVEKNVEKTSQQNSSHNMKQKIKTVKKNIEQKDKKSIVNYDEASRKPVAFPKKFDWRLYAKIVNHPTVNNEEKAIDHFKRYAHNQSKLAKLYFRAIYSIPSLFDEDTYVDYLKTFSLELDKKTIEIEKLYHFYFKTGKNKYPLNDTYSRMYFNIPHHFDYITYCNRYPNVQFDKDDVNSIYDYFSSEKNTKHPMDDEYGRLKYNIPSHFDATMFKKRYSLSFEHDFDSYEFYSKNCDKNFSLDDEYLLLRFNIPTEFSISHYKQRYQETKTMNKIELYTFYSQNKNNKGLDDNYYRIVYNIPELFDQNVYIKRYPQIKCDKNNIGIYKYYNERGEIKELLDDKYYRLLFNIPEYFNPNIFSSLYPETPTNVIDLYKFYKNNQSKYSLSETYFLKYFDISDKNFNSSAYKNTFFNNQDISLYELFKHYSENKENDQFYIKLLNLDENFDWKQYLNENNDIFEEKYLDIDNVFIYNYISNNITMNELYTIYSKEKETDKTKIFKTRYNYLEKNSDKINNEKDKKHMFYALDFVDHYYNNYNIVTEYCDELIISKKDELKTRENKIHRLSEHLTIHYDVDEYNNNLIESMTTIEKTLYKKYIKGEFNFDNVYVCSSYLNDIIKIVCNNYEEHINEIHKYLKTIDLNISVITHNEEIYDVLIDYDNEKILSTSNKYEEGIENVDNEDDEVPFLKQNIITNNILAKLLIEIHYNKLYHNTLTKFNNFHSSISSNFDNFQDNYYDFTFFSKYYNNLNNDDEIYRSLYDRHDLYNIFKINNVKEKNNLRRLSEKQIVFILDNNYIHNLKLIDHLLTIFDETWNLNVVINNFHVELLTKYEHIKNINIINLKDNLLTFSDLNCLIYNETFWELFTGKYIILLNSYSFLHTNIYDNIINNYELGDNVEKHEDKETNNEDNNEDNNETDKETDKETGKESDNETGKESDKETDKETKFMLEKREIINNNIVSLCNDNCTIYGKLIEKKTFDLFIKNFNKNGTTCINLSVKQRKFLKLHLIEDIYYELIFDKKFTEFII